MTRRILCQSCYRKRGPMHPEDVLMGWTQRFVRGKAHKPPEHNVKFYSGENMESLKLTETRELSTLVCDTCNEPIPDSSEAVAITMWRPQVEAEPGEWEKEYLI